MSLNTRVWPTSNQGLNVRKPPTPPVRQQPQGGSGGWAGSRRGGARAGTRLLEQKRKRKRHRAVAMETRGGGATTPAPEEARPLTWSRGYVRGGRRRKCGGGGGWAEGLPGCGVSWPLRAGCHGGNAAGAAGLGPGPTTSLPGLPAPRFGIRGWAPCEGFAASLPLPAAPQPRAVLVSPLPQTQPPRLSGPFTARQYTICHSDRSPPSPILSHVGVSYAWFHGRAFTYKGSSVPSGIRKRVRTPGFDFVLQDPVQDGMASPATPGTGKSKVKRIQYLTSGFT